MGFNLEQFYGEHVDKIYKYFYIQSLDKHIAEDLTSQTFIAFMERNALDLQDNKKYLYGIMRHVWSDYLRQRYKQSLQSIEDIDDFEAHADAQVHEYEDTSFVERAQRYIDRLPEKQRIIARLRFIEERSVKEVASMVGKSSLYVKTTQHRATRNLKSMLEGTIQGSVEL
ncbi:MAG TPA: sigma-70 family RNA polymerase sigma factor [Candidatus Saccharibacteria bacterium]|jgi:RNA polymerase sigma-70 factor (ECF subfamily)|nr:sigma-70 family RNA polymerase sigma factor [Candidatus Saccharibacteria bacterium]HMT55764.1 sigma-70 family RNA polymerase sigma factor [Candidatus Saccharibacteria bacterium]